MKLKNIGYAFVVAMTAAAFVFGSAGSSEAKGKKKAAAKPQTSAGCMFSAPSPVCGTKGKSSFTYRNACYAGNDGAVVTAQKACGPAKAMKGKKKGKKAAKKSKKKAMKKK
jgi:hypothetical protein